MKHRTFSLLPDTLIPYCAITIDTLTFIIQTLIDKNNCSRQALKHIDLVTPMDIIFSEKSLYRYSILFNQARLKLILFFNNNKHEERAPPDIESFTRKDILHFIMRFQDHRIQGIHSNAHRLSHFYYSENGTYMKNAHFLFGTAAQFRK